MSAPKPPPGFTAEQWALVERSIDDGTIPTSPEEPAKSGAPKTRPAITGETTVRELESILRAHHVGDVEAACTGSKWHACLDRDAYRLGESLATALDGALRVLRIEHAAELDLTDEEARS